MKEGIPMKRFLCVLLAMLFVCGAALAEFDLDIKLYPLSEGGEAMVEGVKMTLNTLTESLKRFGFEEVPALGEEFDPEKHNAVMREAGEEPGKVLEVFQKGYKVKDKIIRYAMVKVAVEE
jgi:molecular chaperone GrpE